jgi:high-affinity Fe2+/Pb2+ permease
VDVLLSLTRVWLPVALVVVGIVLIVLGGDSALGATGVGMLIIAVIVWMVNWMFRMSVESNRDREREEAAREYFDEHGRWPDEEG